MQIKWDYKQTKSKKEHVKRTVAYKWQYKENRALYCVPIHCHERVLTAPLPSNSCLNYFHYSSFSHKITISYIVHIKWRFGINRSNTATLLREIFETLSFHMSLYLMMYLFICDLLNPLSVQQMIVRGNLKRAGKIIPSCRSVHFPRWAGRVKTKAQESSNNTFNFNIYVKCNNISLKVRDRLRGLVVRVPGYRSRGPGFDSRHYQIFWEAMSLELSLVRITEKLLESESSRYGRLLVTANVVPSSPILVILMKEGLSSSETSVSTRTTRHNIRIDGILHSHRRENLKSYINKVGSSSTHRLTQTEGRCDLWWRERRWGRFSASTAVSPAIHSFHWLLLDHQVPSSMASKVGQ
jgi:hypothetical protein